MISINDKSECCGCSACANVCPVEAIVMDYDNEGFAYPNISEEICIKCGLCEKVCPIINKSKVSTIEKQTAFLVQNKDTEVCKDSTSGGAFTAIAEYVIEQNGIVFGVTMDKNGFVHHVAAEKLSDLHLFRNSKYVQSWIGDIFRKVKTELKAGRLVCFSGTPCQIEGLISYLRKSYDNLLLVDIVCRAVPSPGVWRRYVQMLKEENVDISSIRFRDKKLGYQFSTMVFKSGKGKYVRAGIESHPWLRMFFSGIIIRPSCADCKFRNRYRSSDFTIWDCFNVHQISKKIDENLGCTRILIHSDMGRDIFEKIKYKFIYEEVSPDLAVYEVKEMIESPKLNPKREQFYLDYNKYSMKDLINIYFPQNTKVVLKYVSRRILNYFGLDRMIKHFLHKR